jgi:CheY-like chemotaxis protein
MGHKIIVIDDDVDFAAQVKLALEAKGYEVLTAASAAAAMSVLDGGFEPDGMILDVMMGGRAEGMIFARRLRKIERHRSIPILMLTGMREATGFGPIKDDPRDPVFLPVDLFLEKPVKQEQLLAKVEELLAAR